MKIAIIHYWLVGVRGGEKVLEAICELYPNTDIFTHVYDSDHFIDSIIYKHNINQSLISKLPFAKRNYQSYLPLMPIALEELDLRGYDLIISSESGPAKGIIPPPGVPHICYCHSPMRYAWDMYHEYKSKAGFLKRMLMPPLMHYLRRWDQATAAQVTQFIANSNFVAKRIKTYYSRDSIVINPPVSFDEFQLSESDGDYYLLLGQLVGYKRADLAVEAFNLSAKKLIVIGDGEQLHDLKKSARANVQILGRQPFSVIKEHLSQCKALIFPGVEDFGIVPLEAMASGRAVIAFKKGGALETVVDGLSGLFFEEQTAQSLNNAILKFETNEHKFNKIEIREHARKFDKDRFKEEFKSLVDKVIRETI
ncbi:glycosyltransferase [Endozoicomonas acroporae]|uniref:glycosyltransferase n=1 Tax=Endozoicomonas acroporae TaxID=1701104 RepID=UPI000C78801C|nr:glycosyltransferase [Endozoicomonas acroporae]